MRNAWKKTVGLCLCACLIWVGILPAFAEGEKTLSITTVTEFLAFAENCRLDQYSDGMTVSLDADLDLQGAEFSGVPIFLGTLEGNDHTITGLSVVQDGSAQGLFRYLGETGTIRHLTVRGEVKPTGSRSDVGGIVGVNSGTLENCRFEGEVSGGDRVGGIVGSNQVSAILDGCTMTGRVHGAHFVGGAAGQNYGVIRNTSNTAEVNATAEENEVEISAITMETVTGTENANTVTDVGGVAGGNTGMIRDCENHGTVGYLHMGYNIGGIVGSQLGYMESCTNFGSVYGRKEVGGIVGQMEPISKIEYRADTLQILDRQLDETAALANQVSSSARHGVESVAEQVDALQGHTTAAKDAVQQLLPDRENPHLPDEDTVVAAHNTLTSSISGAQNSMEQIAQSSRNTALSLSRDVNALTDQINDISSTVRNASNQLGGSVKDCSDQDTDADQTGKVFGCANHGAVQGDLNVGGIAGAMAWENDLDPEDDIQVSGQRSLNFDSELRAVVRSCQNDGTVTVKKRQAGGIVGYMALGLVKDCVNTAEVDAAGGAFVGGIAGRSTGFIRNNSAKCRLKGDRSVGGIAGSGTIVSDCRSLVEIISGEEKLGAVLGTLEADKAPSEESVKGNYYMSVKKDLGGVDGISYAGEAEPLIQEAFFALEGLPEVFRQSRVTFVDGAAESETITLPIGTPLTEENIPAVPPQDGYNGVWDGLEEQGTEGIYFDTTFTAVYDGYEKTIRSKEQREDGKPVLLASGAFSEDRSFEIQPLEALPEVSGTRETVEGWTIPTIDAEGSTQLRISCPEGYDAGELEIQLWGEDGGWRTVDSRVKGSYLVFAVGPTDTGICLVHNTANYGWVPYAGAAAAAALIAGIVVYRKKKTKQAQTEPVGSEV